jgi:outer membrane protein assembly factor BamB
MRWRQQNNVEVQSLFKLRDFGPELEHDPPPPPQLHRRLWHTPVPGGFPFHIVPKSAPLLVGSVLFRGCDAGKMQAFDAATGVLVWEYQVTGAAPGKGIWSTPAFYGDCISAPTMASPIVWTRRQGGRSGCGPTAIGLARRRSVRKYQHGSPAYWAGGDLVIWGIADNVMAGIEAQSGKVMWIFNTRRSVKYAPAICEQRGLVAFASFDKSIYLLDAATGAKLGEWETGEICYTTPLIVGDRMFCGSGDRNVYVINLNTMNLVKKISAGARVYSSPKLIDGRVILGTSGGLIMEIDPDTLEIEGLAQLDDTITNAIAATSDGKRIFVSTYMNHLHAFERLPMSSS